MLKLFLRAFGVLVLAGGTVPAAKADGQEPSGLRPAAIVQLQVDAYNRGDIAAFAALYSEDVEIFDLGPNTAPILKGRAAFVARYAPMLAKFHPIATILSRIETGNFVIDKELTTAGKRSREGGVVYQIENGLIRRVWFTQ